MERLTVKKLKEACDEQIKKGNGDKEVFITTDDEGNGYHALYYLFNDDQNDIKMIDDDDLISEIDVDLNNIVLLG